MAITTNPAENLLYGKGRIYWKVDGESAYLDLGEVPKFELTPTVESEPFYSSRSGTKKKVTEITTSKSMTAALEFVEYNKENLNLALLGGGVTEVTQSAGYFDLASQAVVADKYVDLGKTNLTLLKLTHGTVTSGPFVVGDTVSNSGSFSATIGWVGTGFIEVYNVTIGDLAVGDTITGTTSESATLSAYEYKEDLIVLDDGSSPTTRYTQGTDYDVDVDGGLLRMRSAGSITSPCYIGGDYAEVTQQKFAPLKNSTAEGELLFIGDPDQGPKYRVQGWDCRMVISGGLGLISESVTPVPVNIEIFADETSHPDEPFIRVTEITT